MLKHIKNLLERNKFFIAIIITIAIAYLSLSNPIALKPPIKITFLDKIFHFIAYCSLTLSWLFALNKVLKFKLITISIFLYGILMEFLQGILTTNRQEDVYDILANSLGILFGLLLFNIFYKYLTKYFDK